MKCITKIALLAKNHLYAQQADVTMLVEHTAATRQNSNLSRSTSTFGAVIHMAPTRSMHGQAARLSGLRNLSTIWAARRPMPM